MLSASQVKSLKHKGNSKYNKYSDEKNLYLYIDKNNNKSWWYRYSNKGIEKILSIGSYPAISQQQARDKAREYNNLKRSGIDLAEYVEKQRAAEEIKNANTFEVVGREWIAKEESRWTTSHRNKVVSSLEKDIFPYLGNKPITDIKGIDILPILRKIEERGAVETAHRVLGRCSNIFKFACQTGRAENDPASMLVGSLKPIVSEHRAAVTEASELANLLKIIFGYQGSPVVAAALKIGAYTFVRPGELRTMKWADINFGEKPEWRFVVSKTRRTGVAQHIVPLSPQVVKILEDLRPLTGDSEYVFPNGRSKLRPMSDNAVLSAFRTLGIDKDTMCGHGWRATARTMLEEELGYDYTLIDHQLAHVVRDPLGRAYNRTTHLKERAEMMNRWADYLDELRIK